MANSDRPELGRTGTNSSQFFIVQNNSLVPELIEELEFILANHMDDEIPGTDAVIGDLWPEEFIRHFVENGGTPHLNFRHSVFGQVFRGMDSVDSIAAVEVTDPAAQNFRPIEDVIIQTIEIRTMP
jgi:peptidyl-prolyl cis-trans isomerase B (cyclophilin B)